MIFLEPWIRTFFIILFFLVFFNFKFLFVMGFLFCSSVLEDETEVEDQYEYLTYSQGHTNKKLSMLEASIYRFSESPSDDEVEDLSYIHKPGPYRKEGIDSARRRFKFALANKYNI